VEGALALEPAAPAVPHGPATSIRRHLSEPEAKAVLARFGIATPARRTAVDVRGALAAFRELQPPVAVKLLSKVLHKSDVGGVRLAITDEAGLVEAVQAIDSAAAAHAIGVEGYLVEEMATGGIEVIVGGLVDPVFGPAVMVGLGGIFTEVLDDVALRICPIATSDAMDMIGEIRAAPLLFGARGRPPVDVGALASVLVALGGPEGYLMTHRDHVVEVDLNPVIVSAAGAVAVDARIILGDGAGDAN
jgi:acetate---CoA ligase (ADP-forming) subunit beta